MTLRSAACTPTCPGDLYVVVRLRVAEGEERIVLDAEELLDARWMSAEEVEARCETADDAGKPLAGKVSRGNWEMIRHALEGARVRVAQRHKPLEPRDYARLLAHLTRHCLGELFA